MYWFYHVPTIFSMLVSMDSFFYKLQLGWRKPICWYPETLIARLFINMSIWSNISRRLIDLNSVRMCSNLRFVQIESWKQMTIKIYNFFIEDYWHVNGFKNLAYFYSSLQEHKLCFMQCCINLQCMQLGVRSFK